MVNPSKWYERQMKRWSPAHRIAGAAALLLLTRCSSPHSAPPVALPACSAPRVDTTGWVRQPGPYYGYSFLLPPGFREDTTGLFMHGGRRWRDGARDFSSVNGYWGTSSFRGSYAAEPPRDPGYSECWDTIAGLPVFLSTFTRDGRYTAHAWFRNPHVPDDGFRYYEITLGGNGTSSGEQELYLAIFRTVVPDSAAWPRPRPDAARASR